MPENAEALYYDANDHAIYLTPAVLGLSSEHLADRLAELLCEAQVAIFQSADVLPPLAKTQEAMREDLTRLASAIPVLKKYAWLDLNMTRQERALLALPILDMLYTGAQPANLTFNCKIEENLVKADAHFAHPLFSLDKNSWHCLLPELPAVTLDITPYDLLADLPGERFEHEGYGVYRILPDERGVSISVPLDDEFDVFLTHIDFSQHQLRATLTPPGKQLADRCTMENLTREWIFRTRLTAKHVSAEENPWDDFCKVVATGAASAQRLAGNWLPTTDRLLSSARQAFFNLSAANAADAQSQASAAETVEKAIKLR